MPVACLLSGRADRRQSRSAALGQKSNDHDSPEGATQRTAAFVSPLQGYETNEIRTQGDGNARTTRIAFALG